jgi:hypothetical protein
MMMVSTGGSEPTDTNPTYERARTALTVGQRAHGLPDCSNTIRDESCGHDESTIKSRIDVRLNVELMIGILEVAYAHVYWQVGKA